MRARREVAAEIPIETYGTLGFTWTLNGEAATKEDSATSAITSYTYDALGNLIGVTLPNGDEIEYLVDGLGRRVGKKKNGVLQRAWLWRSQLQPVAELDGTGTVTKRFIYAEGINVPELMIAGGQTYRLIKDHLGSVRLVVNASTGAVAQELLYDAWGRVLADSNPGFQPFGFAGGLYDPETGLVRFGARDYDAEIGRWTAKDPIRFGGGANLVAYGLGDPVNMIDPKGSDAITAAWTWLTTFGAESGGASALVNTGGLLTTLPLATLIVVPALAASYWSMSSIWDEIRDDIAAGKPSPRFFPCTWSSPRASCEVCCDQLCYNFAQPGSLDGVCVGRPDLDSEEFEACKRACSVQQCGG